MFRKLEKKTARSHKVEVKMADSCQCGCTEFGLREEKILPVENKTTGKFGLHFVLKG
jgi:hypothetical protein